MSDLKVLDYSIYREGKSILAEIEQPNGKILELTRVELSANKYKYTIEDDDYNDIDITGIVSKELKQIFATVYHEQYNLKNL